MFKPNFFIVGAPKCGTTALSDYLREHSQIMVSEPKEPHYFATDFEQYRITKTEAEYLELFSHRPAECLAVGEASVFYLYSSVALQNIRDFNPDAKIIVMIRKPQEMVYSLHSQLVYTADESEQDFATAWRLQHKRKQGKYLPKLCREPKLLHYAEIGKLGQQLADLYQVFPAEQIKVILFDDFVRSTKEMYDSVLEFLEVNCDRRTEFPRINSNKVHKSSLIGTFAAKPPQSLTTIALKAKEVLGIKELGIISTLKKLNSQKSKRQPLDSDLYSELTATFETDIKLLAQITNQDLSSWLEPQASSLKCN